MKCDSAAGINEGLRLRPIQEEDFRLLLEWANEPTVRRASFNSSKITESEHKDWFYRALASTKVQIFILERNKIPVGQIRFQQSSNSDSFEINFSIDQNFRGQSLGQELIRLGIERHWKLNSREAHYTAKVKPENFASRKSFLNAGFMTGEETDEIVLFRKTIRDCSELVSHCRTSNG